MMTYFTPGPAQLFPSIETHIRTALDLQIGSISHRSKQFRGIYQHIDEQLRMLLNIPATHAILFTGSATEIWERLLMNCVEHESFHLTNGSFSSKFYDFSIELGKKATKVEKPFGEGFDATLVEVPTTAELICITHNETSSGVQMPVADIHALKQRNSQQLVCVDMVSSAPYPAFDYSLIDTAFFSVQKAFGIPAGLGVWIVNERCLAKAENLKSKGQVIGSYHSLPSLWKNYQNFETPATPNVWSIFLLGKIVEDMNRIGIEVIRSTTERKAQLLYQFIEKSDEFTPFVQHIAHRSQTVVVANCTQPSVEIITKLKEKNIVIGSGYGKFKDSQVRIANFPAVSVAETEQLIQLLANL